MRSYESRSSFYALFSSNGTINCMFISIVLALGVGQWIFQVPVKGGR